MAMDKFAGIAAGGIDTSNEALVMRSVRKPALKRLALQACSERNELFEETETPEHSLARRMQELRAHYAPFLKRHAPAFPATRERLPLTSFDWRVITAEDRLDFLRAFAGEGGWEKVDIPHYGGPMGRAETVYRTSFAFPAIDAGKAVFLHFEGVDYAAHAYLNGCYLGSHEGFFAPFEFECTACIRNGENSLVVCVENDYVMLGSATEDDPTLYTGDKLYAATGLGWDDPQTGWHHCPPGMGIYQPVWLETRPRQFISDLFARPMCGQEQVELHIEAYSCDVAEKDALFRVSLFGSNFDETVLKDHVFHPRTGREVGLGDTFTEAQLNAQGLRDKPVDLPMGRGENYYTVRLPLRGFRTWSPDEPWMYEAHVALLDGHGAVVDEQPCAFGMRTFTMDVEHTPRGMMYLNGQKIRLRGANTMGFEQQNVFRGDDEQLAEDILLAKACNMNFLRLTQRPVESVVYDYCDRLGMLTQTDLPLFGVLRKNKLAEAVRQAEEMERLVRNHPCNIMVTYINERFPNANNRPQRYLNRDDMSAFFEMADRIVHIQNPDRVIKHVDGDYEPPDATLPDNHCYTCWYNGHGVDAGALIRGDWLPVKEGWYYGCGEFGAEGLDPVPLMKKRYPKEWLPQPEAEEAAWSPNAIVGAQTGQFHYFFFETPRSLAEWVSRSQEHQAEATRLMTEAFRRNGDMVSFAIHLFIDAFPAGWMKAIVDADRTPKPAYYAYRDALTPVMISLRTDRLTYTAGETAAVEVWLCNDRPEAVGGARLMYEAELTDGKVLFGETACDIPDSDAVYAGDITFKTASREGVARVRTVLLDQDGHALHRAQQALEVYAAQNLPAGVRAFVPAPFGIAGSLANDVQAELVPREQAACVLFDRYEDYVDDKERYDRMAEEGKKLIFLDLPAGEYTLHHETVNIQKSGMLPMHFLSRDTGHRWVRGFHRKAFRYWYDRAQDRIAAICDHTFVSERFIPVLTSGNTDRRGEWGRAMAAGEMPVGKGSVVLCQVKLAGRVHENPAAMRFAVSMLTE